MTTSTRVQAEELEAVADYVSVQLGVDFSRSRRANLLERISRLMEESDVSRAREYVAGLKRDRHAFDRLVGEVTVGETYFFREPGHFDILAQQVLPGLDGSPGGVVRVWSAGCANGAEAYSLAIVLAEHCKAPFKVVGTDVSAAALAVAASGTYSKWALRTLDERARGEYFERLAGGFRIRRQFARHVTFRRLNLLGDDGRHTNLPPMDVVFCRNVLIYLTPDGIQTAAKRLVAGLTPGGWLFTGAADPSLEDVPGLEAVRTEPGIVYRRSAPAPDLPEVPQEPVVVAAAQSHRESQAGVRSVHPREPRPAAEEDPLEPARTALEGGDFERAAELAQKVVEEGLGGSDAYTIVVRALANRGRVAEAASWCERAAARFPLVAELRYLHCLALLEDGRPAEAASAARAAVYLRSDLAVAHLALGRAESSVGNRKEAARAFRNAAELLRALPDDQPVPLAEGETAGRLATMVDDHDLARADLGNTGRTL